MGHMRMWMTCATVATIGASGAATAVAETKPRAHGAASAGAVYGGLTAQDFPVIVETNKSRRRVVRAAIGIRLSCTSGSTITIADRYADIKVSKRGRFSSLFTNTVRNDDGTTSDLEGSITGALNKARTKVTGKWTFKATDHDPAGAVTDTCEATNISWSAKQ
jgi:hypothetical protein